jgi:hypothetical protein
MENGGLTDRQEAYHNAAINGEAPETLIRGSIPGHSARQENRQENSWPQEIRHQHRRDRSARRAARDSLGGHAIF